MAKISRGQTTAPTAERRWTVSDMFGKKRLKAEVVQLTYRVAELEERLCPCEQHLWRITRIDYEPELNDVTTYYTYKCKRCGKTMKTWQRLLTADMLDGGADNG